MYGCMYVYRCKWMQIMHAWVWTCILTYILHTHLFTYAHPLRFDIQSLTAAAGGTEMAKQAQASALPEKKRRLNRNG